MEILYHSLYATKEELLSELPPGKKYRNVRWDYLKEFLPWLTDMRQHASMVGFDRAVKKRAYTRIINVLLNIVGVNELQKFISLHTDEQKLDIIDQAGDLVKICLPEDMVMEHVKNNPYYKDNNLSQAVMCGHHQIFTYAITNRRERFNETYKKYLIGLAVNPHAKWFEELYDKKYFPPMYYLETLSQMLIEFPNLIVSVKYIYDIVYEKSGISDMDILDGLFEGRMSKKLTFAKCQLVYESNHFTFQVFKDLAENNPNVAEWISTTDV